MTVEDVLEVLGLTNPPLAGLIRSSNVVLSCPFAAVSGHAHQVDRTPSLGILPDDRENGGTWNCFSCGRRGVLEALFHSLEKEVGYDCTAALARLAALLYRDPAEIAASIPSYESHYAPAGDRYRKFPDTWLAPYAGRVAQQLLDRGVEIETCKAWGIGFDTKAQRIVYPVRDAAGALVGAVGGTVRKKKDWERDFVKYRNYWARVHTCSFPLEFRNRKFICRSCDLFDVPQSQVLPGFRKAQHLLGAQFFVQPGPVVIVVEGVVDALKVWQATRDFKDPMGFPVLPLALLGSSPSQAQTDTIVSLSGDRRIVVFLDNDTAGKKGDVELQALVGTRLRYHRAQYPDSRSGADPGSLTAAEIREAISTAKVIMREEKKDWKERKDRLYKKR